MLVQRAFALLILTGCAPTVDGPVERQRALDRADGAQLAAQLVALPGVVKSEVILHRAASDPLAPVPAQPGAAIVVIVDDRADRAAIGDRARELAKAVAPELAPTVVVEVGAERPELARVGPFRVVESSRAALRATLIAGLVVILALAAWVARGYRRGKSAQ